MANGKEVTIYVEGTAHPVEKRKYSLAEIVAFEFPDAGPQPEERYSVKYRPNEHSTDEKIMVVGKDVMVHEGMVFSVSETGQS